MSVPVKVPSVRMITYLFMMALRDSSNVLIICFVLEAFIIILLQSRCYQGFGSHSVST